MNLKIGVFVISVNNDHYLDSKPDYETQSTEKLIERWKLEKKNWEYISEKTNRYFSIHLLECNKKCYDAKNFDCKCINCTESYAPGIFQKTYYSFKHYDDYDFYVRTNLSTFFIFEKLLEFLQKLPLHIPVYTGTDWSNPHYEELFKIKNFKYAQGTCIIMNNKARNIFIDKGLKHINCNGADDALISYIFYKNDIMFKKYNLAQMYFFNYNVKLDKNIEYINNKNVSYIRMKTDDIENYKKAIDQLIAVYYDKVSI